MVELGYSSLDLRFAEKEGEGTVGEMRWGGHNVQFGLVEGRKLCVADKETLQKPKNVKERVFHYVQALDQDLILN